MTLEPAEPAPDPAPSGSVRSARVVRLGTIIGAGVGSALSATTGQIGWLAASIGVRTLCGVLISASYRRP